VHQPARTLPDYVKSQIGFYSDVDQALIDAADLDKPHNKYVALVINEMFIKTDLVYDKHTAALLDLLTSVMSFIGIRWIKVFLSFSCFIYYGIYGQGITAQI